MSFWIFDFLYSVSCSLDDPVMFFDTDSFTDVSTDRTTSRAYHEDITDRLPTIQPSCSHDWY